MYDTGLINKNIKNIVSTYCSKHFVSSQHPDTTTTDFEKDPYAPKTKHIAMATATPTNAATGAPKSAFSSNQSMTAVNGFIVYPFRLVVIF